MSPYHEMSRAALESERQSVLEAIEAIRQQNLDLDMTRGKPSLAQLDLSAELLELPGNGRYSDPRGLDCRNYGGLEGLPGLRALFAEILQVSADEVMVLGNSSLNLMHDSLVRALLFGVPGGKAPWVREASRKFLCPCPGYDRHFLLTQHLGFELLPVPMTDDGPEMDVVEGLVAENEDIKGIWCVPRYSNPTGIVYSDRTVERLMKMKCAAPDFRIFWDDAYAVHYLEAPIAPLMPALESARTAGNPDRVLAFASTSKITYAGAGVAALAASVINLDDARRHMTVQSIGPDKVNQLRHLLFLRDYDVLQRHMTQHAVLLRPKFDAVQEILEETLGASGCARWTKPRGGYFVSLDTQPGCAARVIKEAADLGVKLTPAGATYPGGCDPEDRNIRIAPSFPPVEDIRQAMRVLGLCIRRVTIEQILG